MCHPSFLLPTPAPLYGRPGACSMRGARTGAKDIMQVGFSPSNNYLNTKNKNKSHGKWGNNRENNIIDEQIHELRKMVLESRSRTKDDETREAARAWLAEAKKLEKKWPKTAPSVLEMTKKVAE